MPVIAPVAIGSDGMSYNVNADTMSGAIAAALSARALLLLTDVAGVLDAAPEDGGELLPTLSLDDVSRLLEPEPGPEPCPQPKAPNPGPNPHPNPHPNPNPNPSPNPNPDLTATRWPGSRRRASSRGA